MEDCQQTSQTLSEANHALRKELDELSEKLNLSDEDIEAIEDHYKNKKKKS